VGNKFYDYLGGSRPVLGAVHPNGETRRLIEETRAGWWAGIDDVDGIHRLLLDAVLRADSLLSEFHPDTAKVAQYERAALARRYANLLHAVAHKSSGSTPEGAKPTLFTEGSEEC
jgi:hypothetical protein